MANSISSRTSVAVTLTFFDHDLNATKELIQ